MLCSCRQRILEGIGRSLNAIQLSTKRFSRRNLKLGSKKLRSPILEEGLQHRSLSSRNVIAKKNIKRRKESQEKKPNNTEFPSTEDLKKSKFLSLGVSKQLVKRLEEAGITEPVEIQSLSLRPVSTFQNVVIQSETGSGKTLAYLLPVIQQAKYICNTIIAVPSRELAYQIYLEARKFMPKKDVACYVTKPGIETEFELLKQRPPKIVIGTPKQLLSVVRDHEYLFSNVRRFVADEVDKMLPPIPTGMNWLVKKRERHPKPFSLLLAVVEGITKQRVQYVACSATVTQQLVNTLQDIGWGRNLKLIKSEQCEENSNAMPSCIKHNYLLIPDGSTDSKVAALSKIFTRSGRKPMLVFVHRDHSINEYVTEMKDLNLNAVAFYKQVLGGELQDVKQFLEDFRTGEISIVVASEEEVRGLDFKGLQHVFLFSVPRSADDYLHLAGRVGRVGGKEGTVTTVIAELHEMGLRRLQEIYKHLGVSGNEIDCF